MLPIRVYVIWEKYKKCRRPPEAWGRLLGVGVPAKRTQGSKKKKDKTTTNRKKPPKMFMLNSDLIFPRLTVCCTRVNPAFHPSSWGQWALLTKKPCVHFGRPREPATFCLPSARPPTPVWPTPPPPARPPQRQNKTSGAPINGSVYQIVYYTLFSAVTPSLAMRRLDHFPMPRLLRFNLTLVKRSRWLRALTLLFLFI